MSNRKSKKYTTKSNAITKAVKAGHTFDTFSDNNHDQSFKAIQPAAETFGIDFGDGTIETSEGKLAKALEQFIAGNLTPDSPI